MMTGTGTLQELEHGAYLDETLPGWRDWVSVVGFSGAAQSGKDFLASVAIADGFIPVALANHFKVDGVVRHGLPFDEVFLTTKSPRTRDVLQQVGTEEGREVYGEAIWTRTAECWIAYFVSKGLRRFVISDVRFPDEVEWVQGLGGKVYRITGRGGLADGAELHRSERALDDFDGYDRWVNNAPERAREAVADVQRMLEEDFGTRP